MATKIGGRIINLVGPRPEHFADPQVGRMQQAVLDATQSARTCALVDGVLVEGIKFTAPAVTQNVPHTLGRAYRGFIVTLIDSPTFISLGTPGADTTKFIPLISNGIAKISIWVF